MCRDHGRRCVYPEGSHEAYIEARARKVKGTNRVISTVKGDWHTYTQVTRASDGSKTSSDEGYASVLTKAGNLHAAAMKEWQKTGADPEEKPEDFFGEVREARTLRRREERKAGLKPAEFTAEEREAIDAFEDYPYPRPGLNPFLLKTEKAKKRRRGKSADAVMTADVSDTNHHGDDIHTLRAEVSEMDEEIESLRREKRKHINAKSHAIRHGYAAAVEDADAERERLASEVKELTRIRKSKLSEIGRYLDTGVQ